MSELMDNIKRSVLKGEQFYDLIGTVERVDASANVCDVKPLDGTADVLNVRLQGGEGATEGLLLVPVVGSVVGVSFTGKNSAYVALYSSVSKARLICDDVHLGAEEGSEKAVLGDTLKQKLEGLFGDLDTLMDNLVAFSSTQSGASTGPLAPLAGGFTTLGADATSVKTSLVALKGELNEILSSKVNIA